MPKIPSNISIEKKLRELSDEELNQVAGGAVCAPRMVKARNKCWNCQEYGEKFGFDSYDYIKTCLN